jgi:hypothetical protein
MVRVLLKQWSKQVRRLRVGAAHVHDVHAEADLGQHIVAERELADDHVAAGRLAEAGHDRDGELADGDGAGGRLPQPEQEAHRELADGDDAWPIAMTPMASRPMATTPLATMRLPVSGQMPRV